MKLLLDQNDLLHYSSDWYDDGMGRDDDKRWVYCEVRFNEIDGVYPSDLYDATDETDGEPTCMLCIAEYQNREAEIAVLRDTVDP